MLICQSLALFFCYQLIIKLFVCFALQIKLYFMQNTHYSVGPKFFGTSAKKSWFDEGDRCSPGPGTHQIKRMNSTNPPIWTAGKDTERDTFLQKHHRQWPSPDRYNPVDLNKTHTAQPNYSVPKQNDQQNNHEIDEGNSLDYRPKYNVPKHKYPDYSFGYTFERDYSTAVPPPTAYNAKRIDKKHFNRTQRSFSIGERPMPYGQQGKYPHVGKYRVDGEIGGSKYSFGKGNRPDRAIGASPGKFYNYEDNIKNSNRSKTIGLYIQVPKNKDREEFPSPNKYNSQLPETTTNIINFRAERSEIGNTALVNYPSPDKYDIQVVKKEQTVSFTKEERDIHEPAMSPGVGTYQVEKKLSNTLGHIGLKLKKLTQFTNPAPSAYDPKDELTRPASQKPINYYSARTDFSKSITGKKLGPGVYQTRKKQTTSLGKIGKSQKFPPNRNKNPGPGSYQIPNGIGSLPHYCSGPKKLTTTGFSYIELDRQQKIRIQRQRLRLIKQKQQKLQQQILQAKESDVSMH